MDNNIQENVVETQENIPVGLEVKKPSKKKFIIISAVAVIAILAVVLILLLGNSGKGKIEINGKKCTYSAEAGIEGVEKACDGVVVCDSGNCTYYPTSGEAEEVSMMDIFDGKYPVVFFPPFINFDEDLAGFNYNIYGEFKTQYGATHESSSSDLSEKDFLEVDDMFYMIYTDEGTLDWDDIKKDYDKIASSGSFKDIDYFESALLVAADVVKINAYEDNAQAVIDTYNTASSSGKENMMLWLARGKAIQMLLDGDIEYVAIESVYCQSGRDNSLNIYMYTSKEDAQKVMENMGIK
ncbi:MAG: hypothetical protein E7259_09385 [Lachnospiraceae bacterium]|nr:hypothetical protein [Lachnospiraceae bacterium]